MAAYIHADVAKVIHSPDGAFKIEFLRRNDDLCEYRGFERRREESPLTDSYYCRRANILGFMRRWKSWKRLRD
jgi:hypothetical protein